MTKSTKLTEADLKHFTGSEHWYRHALNRKVLFTDGAKYVADKGGAYWLIDTIARTPDRIPMHMSSLAPRSEPSGKTAST